MRGEAIWALTLSVTLILAGSAAPAGQDVTFHFLRAEGKAYYLERISINGKLVIASKLITLDLPVYVTNYLRKGANTLEIEYTSHRTTGLKIFIEERRRGSPERKGIVKFSSAAGATQGIKVRKVIGFTAYPRLPTAITLDGSDREAILRLIKGYQSALSAKNAANVLKFTERAIKEESNIYTEGMKFHAVGRQTLVDTAFSIPDFGMTPLQLDGLRFLADKDMAVVFRPPQLPVISSGEYEIEQEVVFLFNGREVRTTVKEKFSIAPQALHFKTYGGEWYFAVPFDLVSLIGGAPLSIGRP